MSEISILNGYKIKDKKAVRYYDTISNMKSDTTLKAGMYVKTKGYYSVNDGGSAEYVITNIESESEFQEELTNGLYANLQIENLNVLQLGFHNDGINANDEKMSLYLNKFESIPLYFPSGTYLFNNEIKFVNECHLKLEKNAIIKANDEMDYLISVRRESTASDYSNDSYIDGGTFDCNNKAGIGFTSYKCSPFTLTNCIIYNPVINGIATRPSDNILPDGNHRIINVKLEKTDDIEDTPLYTETKGIYDNGFDNFFMNITVCNFKYGIESTAGRFDNGTCWIRSKALLPDSVGFKSRGYDIYLSNWAIDTYRYGFKIDAPGHSLIANNILWITNKLVYTSDLQQTYPRVIFDEIYDDRLFKINGLKLIENENITFAKGKLPSSSFINIFTPSDLNTSTITNFRNDNLYIDQLKNFFRIDTYQTKLNENVDYDHLEDGVYVYSSETTTTESGVNPPLINGFGNLLQISSGNSQNVKIQALFIANTPKIVYRVRFANTWRAWQTLS